MGEIAPEEEQFLHLSTIFCYLVLDVYVKTRIRFSLRDKRLIEITEVEITRVDCICFNATLKFLAHSSSVFYFNILSASYFDCNLLHVSSQTCV